MLIRLIAAAILAAAPSLACAQSSPNWSRGYVPSAGEINGAFAKKQDKLQYTPLSQSGGTMTGKLQAAPATINGAGLSILPGVAPTAPSNGDLWSTGVGLYGRFGSRTLAIPGMDQNTGALSVPGGPTLGAYQNGKFTSQPYKIQLQGSGSTGPGEGFDVLPPVLPANLASRVTIGQLFSDAINARFFGVKCDGVTDDTQALAQAAASGKLVQFQPGVCLTSQGVTFASGTKWYAMVPRATEIRANAQLAADQMIGGNGVSDIEIVGFNLNTQKTLFPNKATTVVYFNNSYYGPTSGSRIKVNNNYVAGSTSSGITIDNTTNVSLNDNEVTDTYRDAIRCGTCDGVWALRNNIHDMPNLANGFRAIIIGSSKNAYATDNRIANLRKSDGAESNFAFDFGGTVRFTIANNQIDGVQSFVDLEGGSARGVIANNTHGGLITSTANVDLNSFGVYCINNGCSHIRVNGNDITGVYTPIRIEGGFAYNIAGNDLHDFYGPGILSVPVSGVGIYANPDSPSGAVDAVVATGNVVTNGSLAVYQAASGIDVQSTTGVISGNTVRGGFFKWDINDYQVNSNVEIGLNMLGGNGLSSAKFGGFTNLRGVREYTGTGSPNGTVAGSPGDKYINRSGGTSQTYWVKESGTSTSTGWVAK